MFDDSEKIVPVVQETINRVDYVKYNNLDIATETEVRMIINIRPQNRRVYVNKNGTINIYWKGTEYVI